MILDLGRGGRATSRVAVVAIVAVLAAACGADGVGGQGRVDPASSASAECFHVEQVERGPVDVEVSGLRDPGSGDLPTPLIDLQRLRPGGPPPDGIPPIEQPCFLHVDDVDFLDDNEAVLAIEVDGDARAYPLQIMIWHEIVNDTIGGHPVTVTYCPLCNSALAYDRNLDGRVLDFGTSGMLYNSALVMYDRQTESLWSHFSAEAIVGELTGARLDVLPVATVSWADFRQSHPDGIVLGLQTGHSRRYGSNPYVGYDDPDNIPFLFDGEIDGRLSAMTRVVGIRDESGAAVAVLWTELVERRVVEVELGGRELVVWLKPGTASAIEDSSVAGGRDVGATGVFSPVVDGQRLGFEPAGDGFRDAQSGSSWDVLGRAADGPLAGRALEAHPHVDTFWFAWVAFLPDTAVVPPLESPSP